MTAEDQNLPTIWIDADSCPRAVRDIAIRFSRRLNSKIQVVFVANREIGASSDGYRMVVCGDKKDAADNHILENALPSDLVVTRDIIFAERLVEKGICAINDRGTHFNRENIKNLVEDRNFDLQLAQIGLAGTKRHSYGKRELGKFIECFEKQLKNLLNGRQAILRN